MRGRQQRDVVSYTYAAGAERKCVCVYKYMSRVCMKMASSTDLHCLTTLELCEFLRSKDISEDIIDKFESKYLF